jgi:hypothetical protein
MMADEAQKVLDAAFPGQGVTWKREGHAAVVRTLDGTVIGKAFSVEAALKEAVKPVLEAAAIKARDSQREKENEFRLFMQFLRTSHDAEFKLFLAAQAAVAPSDNVGAEPLQKLLVQVVSR